MDFAALPGYLEEIKARVEGAAVPAAGAIAKTYEHHLVDVTLIESGSHAPVTQTPAPEGRPPAEMPGGLNGSLRGSVEMFGPTGGGGVGYASVSPDVIYAATQEWGGIHHAVAGPYMWLWIGYIGAYEVRRRGWRRTTVDIPSRPYMRTAVAETFATGELSRAAEATFEAFVWGG